MVLNLLTLAKFNAGGGKYDAVHPALHLAITLSIKNEKNTSQIVPPAIFPLRSKTVAVGLRDIMFTGLYETHIDVVDLDRSVSFYEDVLQLELGVKVVVDAARADSHSKGAKRVAIMWIGGQGHAALGLWERRQIGSMSSISPSRSRGPKCVR